MPARRRFLLGPPAAAARVTARAALTPAALLILVAVLLSAVQVSAASAAVPPAGVALDSAASRVGEDPPASPPRRYDYSNDNRYYSSPWYVGAWQEMIPFGCTRAPFYPRDPSCPRARPGRHHGVDMYMPCGTRLRSAVRGRAVRDHGLGSAYGAHPLLIRTRWADFVLGHARRLVVEPGQRVRPGQTVARSGKSGAPDGCHLHFEKRPRYGSYTSAVKPLRALRRTVVTF